MKHLRTAHLLLAACLLVFAVAEVSAQKVEIVAKSPGRLGSYAAGTFPISSGLGVVPLGMKVYLTAHDSVAITSYAWTLTGPASSTATISDAAKDSVTFVPDLAGVYIVSVTMNGGDIAADTLYASTYNGLPTAGLSCGMCHLAKKTEWEKTNHATIFTRGITGQLEVEEYMGQTVGVYSKSCLKCHTTGWEPNVDNGNFGFLAYQSGFDTTWYKAGQPVGGEYVIPYADSSMFINMQTNYAAVAAVASIGCESCHGPGKDHVMNGGGTAGNRMIGVSFEGGVCLQCHDAPNKHRLGSYWLASTHSNMALSAEEAGRSSCWPCHNGAAFKDYVENMAAPDYSKTEIVESIACATCHDPHSDANPKQLRTMTMLPLKNGYVPPAGTGGMGALCMNCHRNRDNATTKVEAQARVYGNRFYPHYAPQADMYLGANAYDYGLTGLIGSGTHLNLDDGCVTCHMATRTIGSSALPNHQMSMKDAQGNDIVTACKPCHGSKMTKFDDVQAFADYDGDGVTEGAQTEIDGLLERLKAILPKNGAGEVPTMNVDSAIVKADPNWPKNLAAIYNYHFVTHDLSHGVHNMKYAVGILRASLGTLTGVEPIDQKVPGTFSLQQNYPNPFNPTTTVAFAVPQSGKTVIAVYNSDGQLVKKLADGDLAPGNYSATWDATDATGARVSSGVYFYRMSVENNGKSLYQSTRKMVLLK